MPHAITDIKTCFENQCNKIYPKIFKHFDQGLFLAVVGSKSHCEKSELSAIDIFGNPYSIREKTNVHFDSYVKYIEAKGKEFAIPFRAIYVNQPHCNVIVAFKGQLVELSNDEVNLLPNFNALLTAHGDLYRLCCQALESNCSFQDLDLCLMNGKIKIYGIKNYSKNTNYPNIITNWTKALSVLADFKRNERFNARELFLLTEKKLEIMLLFINKLMLKSPEREMHKTWKNALSDLQKKQRFLEDKARFETRPEFFQRWIDATNKQ